MDAKPHMDLLVNYVHSDAKIKNNRKWKRSEATYASSGKITPTTIPNNLAVYPQGCYYLKVGRRYKFSGRENILQRGMHIRPTQFERAYLRK
jgi:hypothetical protein